MAKSRKPDPAAQDKDPELVAVGLVIAELRNAKGLTQEGLAHAAGLHWTYIGQVERGERNLSYKSVRKLADGLGVSMQQLGRAIDRRR
jgi:transcriptional regulator with XRE-family HTH domain